MANRSRCSDYIYRCKNTDFTVLFPTVAESDGFYHVTLTIRVYLEGFDPYTINGILGSKLKVGLVFGLVTA